MKQGKYAAPVRRRRRRNPLKPMLIAMAVVLLLGCVTGGTLAWLTSTTGEVVNTFTTSDITIGLAETKGNSFKMIPGYTIEKDPKVTVEAGSEACWLFVKVEKSTNFDTFMEYEMADGWTQLQGVTGVYYRKVLTADIGTTYSVLKGDQVTVKSDVTKAMMKGLTDTTHPTLTFQAAAVQLYKNNNATDNEFTATQAYEKVVWPTT